MLRHHDYTHREDGPGTQTVRTGTIMRDICRWHVEELAYLLGQPEGDPRGGRHAARSHVPLLSVHEHAEANPHKNNGHGVIVAGHASKLRTGMHTRTTGTIADLYTAVANKAVGAGLKTFPSGSRELTEIFS